MEIQFITVDVFTNTRFSGNPLAVVPDARGLSDEQMQQIAREFNLSETTFVLPAADNKHTANVRIFTPLAEMPFAGHPNVGTAYVLASEGRVLGNDVTGDAMVFEELAGLVRMHIHRDNGLLAGARLQSPQPVSVGKTLDPRTIADACSLRVDDIVTEHHAPACVSCGVPFVIAEVTTRDRLAASTPRADVFSEHLPRDLYTGIHLYCRDDSENLAPGAPGIHARMFAPLHGVSEDPATGSANVALAGLLAQVDRQMNCELDFIIEQGTDMGKTSILKATARKRAGKVDATWIAGDCVTVSRGVLEVA